MTAFSLDNSGDARLALQEIYRDYGLAGIDDESLVNRLLPDLLPDSPREASLLRSAAGANVGHLLTDRISAQMPADAAVRDVTAMLVTRLAFDSTACLWVVSEYARAIGHPVDIAPADVEPAHMDPNVGAARYVPGRAGPVFPPGANDVSGAIRIPARRNYVPLVVAIVAVVAIIGTIGIVLALRPKNSCTGSACVTGSKQTPSTPAQPSTQVSSQASSPSAAPPTGGPSTLADVMPFDLSVDDDCDSDGTPFLDHLSAYYACTESDESTMSGMSVWGYQFATKSAYQAGIAQFNTKVSFSAASAGTACPPTSSGDGSVTWHRNDNVDLALGHLECYYSGNHKNKDYAWTDDADFTLMVAEATPSETFAQLHTWWTHNNNNESE